MHTISATCGSWAAWASTSRPRKPVAPVRSTQNRGCGPPRPRRPPPHVEVARSARRAPARSGPRGHGSGNRHPAIPGRGAGASPARGPDRGGRPPGRAAPSPALRVTAAPAARPTRRRSGGRCGWPGAGWRERRGASRGGWRRGAPRDGSVPHLAAGRPIDARDVAPEVARRSGRRRVRAERAGRRRARVAQWTVGRDGGTWWSPGVSGPEKKMHSHGSAE